MFGAILGAAWGSPSAASGWTRGCGRSTATLRWAAGDGDHAQRPGPLQRQPRRLHQQRDPLPLGGDQILWELKTAEGTYADAAGGAVSYFHASGIDRPLVITKVGHPPVIPHQNWRGKYLLGTYSNGQLSDCTGGQTSGCELIAWPGHRTTAWHKGGLNLWGFAAGDPLNYSTRTVSAPKRVGHNPKGRSVFCRCRHSRKRIQSSTQVAENG